jgi:hypothetical protein
MGLTEDKRQVLRYVEAGATGYGPKDHPLEDLVEFSFQNISSSISLPCDCIYGIFPVRVLPLGRKFGNKKRVGR